MKVCLDTNILVSGIYWKGVPGKVIERWLENHFELIVSPSILEEYQETLRELGVKINPVQAEIWIQIITQKASVISLSPTQARWSRDPDDDKFIHCALVGKADYLVSGDKDLLALKGEVPVKILSASEFFRLFQ